MIGYIGSTQQKQKVGEVESILVDRRHIVQMRTHLPFSIHGLIFLSGEWIRKSPFSLSSMNAFIASMDLLRGHLSILAWKRMLAICKLRLSLSMAAVWLLGLGRGLAEYRLGGGGWWRRRRKRRRLVVPPACRPPNCFPWPFL